MTKPTKKFAILTTLIACATSGAVSAEAQRKASPVEPSVAESVKQQQAPRIRLPQQQPAPAAPQTSAPIPVDVSSSRVRLPSSRLSTRQRKQLAEGLAQRAITGVGRPAILAYEKRQVSLPRKIETTIAGYIDLNEGIGLRLRSFPYGSTLRPAVLGVEVFEAADSGAEYFLVDVHYRSIPNPTNNENFRPFLSVNYKLNGTTKSDELPAEAQPDGIFTFLMDANSSIAAPRNTSHSFDLLGTSIVLRAIEVRPVQ